jgi:hypothetical protein
MARTRGITTTGGADGFASLIELIKRPTPA